MRGVLEQVEGWPVDTVAAGVRCPDGTVHTWGPAERPFALASVTKVLVAHAVLVAVEEGTVDLDQPAGPPGSTVRHLLAHASGLGPDRPEPLTGPGRQRIYSNAGFEVLGATLEAAAGMTTARYLHEALVEPLGLAHTRLEGSPAHGAVSTVAELLAIAGEWIAPSLVSPGTVADARRPQFPDLSGVLPGYGRQDPNPWGLGVEVKGNKDPHWTGRTNSPLTFGHFGRAGTLWWVDPEHDVAVAVLSDRSFGPWALQRWPALADAVLVRLA